MKHVLAAATSLALAASCGSKSKAPAGPTDQKPPPAKVATYDRVARVDFNRRAAEQALPLFWRTDADGDKTLDPDELVTLWGWPGPSLDQLVSGNSFTPAFAAIAPCPVANRRCR